MRKHNPEYRMIANRIIKQRESLHFIRDLGVKVAYLESDEEKKTNGKIVLGDCTKVNQRYEWCCPYDFFITLYEPNIKDLNPDQLAILLYHELQHIGLDEDGIAPKLYCKPHDVEEFDSIINEFGIHWEAGGC